MMFQIVTWTEQIWTFHQVKVEACDYVCVEQRTCDGSPHNGYAEGDDNAGDLHGRHVAGGPAVLLQPGEHLGQAAQMGQSLRLRCFTMYVHKTHAFLHACQFSSILK